jgi:hypothetical protein
MKRFLLLFAILSALPILANASTEECADDFSKIINAHDSNREVEKKMSQIVLEEISDSYRDVERSSPARIATWNKVLLKKLRRLPMTGAERGRLSGLSMAQINQLYEKVANHSVGSLKVVKRYDPDGNIGFCFGRASISHVEALEMGLAKENVKKIWAIGSMKYEDIFWQHHVSGIVRRDDGVWFTIDPEYDYPRKLDEWAKIVKKMDADGKLQFFVTDAKRFGPDDFNTYNIAGPDKRDDTTVNITDDFYNKYFVDWLKATREEAAEINTAREAAKLSK